MQLLLFGFLVQKYYERISVVLEAAGHQVIHCSSSATLGTGNRSRANIDTRELYRMESIGRAFPSSLKPAALSSSELKRFEPHKLLALRTIDRVYIEPISIRKAEAYINRLAGYWLAYLRMHQAPIDAAIFTAVPHFPWTITLDFAAAECGIPRRYVRETSLDGAVFIGADMVRGFSKSIRFPDQSPYLLDVSEGMMRLSSYRNLAANRSRQAVRPPSRFRLMRRIGSVLFRSAAQVSLRQGDRWFSSRYFRLSPAAYSLLVAKNLLHYRRIYRWLAANAIRDTPTEPFVLFALHMQPERTTDPESSDFTHQIEALRLLSQSMDGRTRILVKEHPAQIAGALDIRKLHFRSISEYAEIAQIENVSIVAPDVDSRVLIEASLAVASPRGTVLWEAQVMGKVSLSFAPTWHSGCRTSPTVGSVEELREALEFSRSMSREAVRAEAQDFLHTHRNCFVRATFNDRQWSRTGRPWDDVESLANALLESLVLGGLAEPESLEFGPRGF